MGKPLGKLIGAYIPESLIARLDEAVISTKSETRSKLILYIVKDWLDRNGF
jgi:metal-responsive CopG/Arc/MetJ family transcriptional regulator